MPVDGWEDKCLYVWFEAVIGYLSAAIEWAKNQGQPERWREWWYNPEARTVYFIGKDNIPFHSIIWPAILMVRATRTLVTSGSAATAAAWAGVISASKPVTALP